MTAHQYMYRVNFSSFVDFAFRELHPGEFFADNWHIDFISKLLPFIYYAPEEDVCRKLILNLPPGHLKSHICSVSFPAWVLGRDPRQRVLIVSESPDLAMELREQCVELMRTSRYRAIFPRARIKSVGKSVEMSYGGGISHAGIGYHSQHKRSDLVVIDNPQSLHSLHRLNPESLIELNRLMKSPTAGMMVLNTRRLADEDMSHHLLHRIGGWSQVSIPAVALKDEKWAFPPFVQYNRRKGEPLQSQFGDWEEYSKRLNEMGAFAFAHQYLQSQYTPSSRNRRVFTDDNGQKWEAIGKIDETTVARDEMRVLQREYLEGVRDDLEKMQNDLMPEAE